VARGEREETVAYRWFRPAATEAIAFFVLALLRAAKEADDPPPLEEVGVFISFLLIHREGAEWHSTRDTALAVLALLCYEEQLGAGAEGASLRLVLNGSEKAALALDGRLDARPPGVLLRDEELKTGENELTLEASGARAASLAQPRYYSLTLRYFSQEDELPATEQGVAVERSYWLLDDMQRPSRRIASGEAIAVGQRLRVELALKAKTSLRYLLIEDPKLAGCEPVAKRSGPEVCRGQCAHVELRVDRVAIFLDALGRDEERLSYDIVAQLPGRFTAMPARAGTMYDSELFGTSGSFALAIRE
jgi:alpha-2-macroglobulin